MDVRRSIDAVSSVPMVVAVGFFFILTTVVGSARSLAAVG
jgi:hypothetical protein